MEVSGLNPVNNSFRQSPAIDKVSSAEKPGKTGVAVAKNAIEDQKAEGAQLVDMIQKSGSIIDVEA